MRMPLPAATASIAMAMPAFCCPDERTSMRLFLLLAAFAATPALAQQAPITPVVPAQAQPAATVMAEPVAMMIAAFDSDGDAKVSRAEFQLGLRHSFDNLDTRKT